MDKKALQLLFVELKEERSASVVLANNGMPMITRLQAEKVVVQMGALQYQRMVEEYDQDAIHILQDLVSKRDEHIRVIESELESYREKNADIKLVLSKAYLPSQTPKGLRYLKTKELKSKRGNGNGHRIPSDRV
ncbi:probable myosin-binding protein 5 [Tanacetum coccineum]